ncbi:MAG TPA: hypothetical protein VGA73_00100, partial [Candidatus Binatia bacterium]
DCEKSVRERLARREANFLDRMRQAVYQNERSPYLPLMRGAGIGFEDVRAAVGQKGLDATLKDLRAAGVYLSFEEYKGRRPIERHGKSYRFDPAGISNRPGGAMEASTGGSTGPPVRVSQSLSFQRDNAVHTGLIMGLWMPPNGKVALWRSEPPASSLPTLMRFTLTGHPPAAWFTPVWDEYGESWRKRMLLKTTLRMARRRGLRIPDPEYVPLGEAHRIAEWIAAEKRAGVACLVQSNVSSAVRVCEAARRQSLDIGGARFFMISEPLTEAKREEIEAAGAVPISVYSAVDAGRLAVPCERPTAADDMHVCTDVAAIIAHGRLRPGSEETIDSLLITTLLPANPFFLLNVEFDDFGTLEARDCGCRLAALGLGLHLSRVRSFAKLTSQGTTVPMASVAGVVEKALPRRFGGASIHYQLLEEDLGSDTRLTLVISPQVGPLDERAVIEGFLAELGASRIRVAARLWEESGTLRVVRAEPVLTPRGKLMPVRVLGDYERARLPG